MKTEAQVVYDNLISVRRLLNMPFQKAENRYNGWKPVNISYIEIERIDDALRMLKKHIVKGTVNNACPECGFEFDNGDLDFSYIDESLFYCPRCGQAVKFNE